jgi:hypothetical protein
VERIVRSRAGTHAAQAVLAAAGILSAPARADIAAPFSPDPAIEEAGAVHVGVIENNYQTLGASGRDGAMHHPWAVELESAVNSRLAVQAQFSDAIALGMKAALAKDKLDGYDLSMGFDQLLYPTEKKLFGDVKTSEANYSGRAWLGVARRWRWVRPRAALAAEPRSGHLRAVPHLAMESTLDLPVSVGFDSRFESGIWRMDGGLGLEWKPFRLAVGLAEVQSWVCRKGKFGWFGSPREGTSSGVDNPGWWVSASLDVPSFAAKETEARASAPTSGPPSDPTVDAQSLQALADLLQQRSLRTEIAELAARARVDSGMDPAAISVLRHRILGGGPHARAAVWRIALDPQIPDDQRLQAALTLSDDATLADTSGLSLLARDPVPSLRMEAALTLGRIPSEASDRLLSVLRLDPDQSVRESAKAASSRP